jgi:hypothetical protein
MSETMSDDVRLNQLRHQANHIAINALSGLPILRVGLITTLYFKNGHTLEAKQRVSECFIRFYREFRPELKWQVYKRMRRLAPAGFGACRRQILESAPEEQFAWSLSSATDQEVANYRLFVMNAPLGQANNDLSCLKMVLPLSYLSEAGHLSQYAAWLKFLCGQLHAEHGFGALACILPCESQNYLSQEYRLAQEYPGLMVDAMPHVDSLRLLDHIKGVNWFTVLCSRFVKRVGGNDVLRRSLSRYSDIIFHPYDGGLIIRAGSTPQLGRVDQAPDAYVRVNKAVKAIRLQDTGCLHPHPVPGQGFTEETTSLWYARFDEKPKPPVNAGQTCPCSGYWFSNAQAKSRRYFNEGEPMPGFERVKPERTQWFWTGGAE